MVRINTNEKTENNKHNNNVNNHNSDNTKKNNTRNMDNNNINSKQKYRGSSSKNPWLQDAPLRPVSLWLVFLRDLCQNRWGILEAFCG